MNIEDCYKVIKIAGIHEKISIQIEVNSVHLEDAWEDQKNLKEYYKEWVKRNYV